MTEAAYSIDELLACYFTEHEENGDPRLRRTP